MMSSKIWLEKTEGIVEELNKADAGARPGVFIGTMFGALCFMFEAVKAQERQIERMDGQIKSLTQMVSDHLMKGAR